MSYLYLLIDIGTILIPFLFSFQKKAPFYKEWKNFFLANFIVASGFIAWDIAFTKMGVWGFNPTYLTGLYFFNLPIEEVLFFICVPYSCTFIFFAFQFYLKKYRLEKWPVKKILFGLTILCSIVAILHYDHWYTATSFGLCVPFLVWMLKWPARNAIVFLIAFVISVLPFTLVNGILTGSGIENQIVWYNDLENLGIRFFTIPIDDFSYSFILQGFQVGLYLKLNNR